jgi:predicted small secreted protein
MIHSTGVVDRVPGSISARAGQALNDLPDVDIAHERAPLAGARSNPRGKLMTRLIALLLIAGTAVLAGCNTMAGAGQDISKGGSAITNSADKHAD